MSLKSVIVVVALSAFGLAASRVMAEDEPGPCAQLQEAAAIQDCVVDLNARLFREVMVHGNQDALVEMALPETILVVPSGVEVVDQVQGEGNMPKAQDLEVQNEHFLANGDTAVLAGVLSLQGMMGERPLPPRVRYLSVFVDTGNGWRLPARSLILAGRRK